MDNPMGVLHFAGKHHISLQQATELLRLADVALERQEANEGAVAAMNAFEAYAGTLGFGTTWQDGLYPVLLDQNRDRIFLPV